jgi:hypothetical protein
MIYDETKWAWRHERANRRLTGITLWREYAAATTRSMYNRVQ